MKKLAIGVLSAAALASAACTIDVRGMQDEGVVVREQKRISLTGDPNVTPVSYAPGSPIAYSRTGRPGLSSGGPCDGCPSWDNRGTIRQVTTVRPDAHGSIS